ncbi:TIGR01841 family phasin [Paraburkholderia sp. MM5482-R1]|uniref:TIGR01841 family phasin n=1 Tax=unclassified Paraburkholderia TaxID=2615204 RepID=UPI003D25D6E0
MSALMPEQLITSHKAYIATLFTLTGQTFDGYRKLVELNLATARGAGAESAKLYQEVLSCKTPEELLVQHASGLRPASAHILSYAGRFCDIVRETQSKWMQAAQSQYDAANRYASKS